MLSGLTIFMCVVFFTLPPRKHIGTPVPWKIVRSKEPQAVMVDRVVAALYQHTRDLEAAGTTQHTGHIGHFKSKVLHLTDAVSRLPPGSMYCEVGLDQGHRALTVLESNPGVSVTSFEMEPSENAVKLMRSKYGSRFRLVIGDANVTLAKAVAKREHMCDSVLVDGDHHIEIATSNAARLCQLSRPGSPLVIDDDYGAVSTKLKDDTIISGDKVCSLEHVILTEGSDLHKTYNGKVGDKIGGAMCVTSCM
eukprot:CAMPEP_0198725786 /NCGR_PEP_ID=MMETSP1475-20131203/3027_1 /TAXON_ID= ORGANISM="Unidentified sp., Strain CCMP1999" /NCGR_SAMPLE_ID=MMETSP1475 /ASSEMBLY_ACC=CAM_ASM_001111 /LENGTH=249 /DNA_ID=CAMNT_0044487619 /DNA_START=351 /DNA_END=1100 /DNA_ORIENTATION=+